VRRARSGDNSSLLCGARKASNLRSAAPADGALWVKALQGRRKGMTRLLRRPPRTRLRPPRPARLSRPHANPRGRSACACLSGRPRPTALDASASRRPPPPVARTENHGGLWRRQRCIKNISRQRRGRVPGTFPLLFPRRNESGQIVLRRRLRAGSAPALSSISRYRMDYAGGEDAFGARRPGPGDVLRALSKIICSGSMVADRAEHPPPPQPSAQRGRLPGSVSGMCPPARNPAGGRPLGQTWPYRAPPSPQ